MFFEDNAHKLREFSRMSKEAGARADYVQGGGGNTSVKLKDGLMAIKASGYCLSDMEPDKGYAVLDASALRQFYLTTEIGQFADVEKSGSEAAAKTVQTIDGLKQLRPSVEAGFHSLLKTYVVHTHSVYANLAACSVGGREIAAKALAGADYSWGMVDYVDPGARLTYEIRDELRRVEAETGRVPEVILMENHGILTHADDPDRALAIHADANERLAQAYGISGSSFPTVTIAEREPGLWENTTDYLTEALKTGRFTEHMLLEEPLYPDQMVFLVGSFSMNKDTVEPGQCVANSETGQVLMRMERSKALVMAEILTAVAFIQNHIEAAGQTLCTMGAAAKNFIANWESEKYRKTLKK